MPEEEEEAPSITRIYVHPTEEGKPPRALVEQITQAGEVIPVENPDDDEPRGIVALEVVSMDAVWSRDSGTWVNGPDARPLPQDLADAITEHAKELGVEW